MSDTEKVGVNSFFKRSTTKRKINDATESVTNSKIFNGDSINASYHSRLSHQLKNKTNGKKKTNKSKSRTSGKIQEGPGDTQDKTSQRHTSTKTSKKPKLNTLGFNQSLNISDSVDELMNPPNLNVSYVSHSIRVFDDQNSMNMQQSF